MKEVFICKTNQVKFSIGDWVYIDDLLSPVIQEYMKVTVKRSGNTVLLVDAYNIVRGQSLIESGNVVELQIVSDKVAGKK